MTKSLSITKTLTVAGKEVTVKKLPLKKVIALIEAVGKLPSEITSVDTKDTNEVIANIGLIIAQSLPRFIDAVVTAIDQQDITREWILDNCDLNDSLDLIIAILEVNDVAGILSRIKKLRALNQAPAVPVKQPQRIG